MERTGRIHPSHEQCTQPQPWLETLLQVLARRSGQPDRQRGGRPTGQCRDWPWPTHRTEAWRFTDPGCLTQLDPTRIHTRTASPPWPDAAVSSRHVSLQLDGRGHWLSPQGEPPTWPHGLMPLPTEEITPGQVAHTVIPSGTLPLGAKLNGVTPGPSLGLQVRGPDPVHLALAIQVEQAQAWLAPHLLLVLQPGRPVVPELARGCNSPSCGDARGGDPVGAWRSTGGGHHGLGLPRGHLPEQQLHQPIPPERLPTHQRGLGMGPERDEPFIRQSQGQAETHLYSLAVARGSPFWIPIARCTLTARQANCGSGTRPLPMIGATASSMAGLWCHGWPSRRMPAN